MIDIPQLIVSFMQLIFWIKSFSGADCSEDEDVCTGAGQFCDDSGECACNPETHFQSGDVCVDRSASTVGKFLF